MESLLDLAQKMQNLSDLYRRVEAERLFVEKLTFSEFDDIVMMLDEMLETHWIDFPVWARNLSFRLACLLAPNNIEIRRRTAIDLRSFGPDWDIEADRLDEIANELEKKLRY